VLTALTSSKGMIEQETYSSGRWQARGMIASRFKKDDQNQLLGRHRVLCRSDPLSWSTIASVVWSEVVVLCAVYASAASCQADVLPHQLWGQLVIAPLVVHTRWVGLTWSSMSPRQGAKTGFRPARQSATRIAPICSWEAPLRSAPQKHPSYWTNILGGMGRKCWGP